MKTIGDAMALLHEYTQGESLRRHAYAVAAAMRAYAERFGEDPDTYEMTGLLHDFDYERYPDLSQHTVVGARILREQDWPEEIVHAILAHNDRNGVARDTLLAKTLYACDELSGFVMAVAMVKPTRDLRDVSVKSVKKKLKDKTFARGVNRDDVYRGAEELGVALEEHIEMVIGALTRVAARLGLNGQESA
ncbi:HD domain-containing protein [Alicyclobacillus kakegawensis]|uniref:HD domain-containing protein n=1 Tax=Alicyclobacillus kakegawensis TaxID=392012 RepID=UPI000B0D0F24|nr:HD domain-containing protein [Alicyclobacillus kakegawensis]